MVADADLKPGSDATDRIAFRGQLAVVDNIADPRVVKSVQLSQTVKAPIQGIQIRAVTIMRHDHPQTQSLTKALPYLAAIETRPSEGSTAPLKERRAYSSAVRTHEFTAIVYAVGKSCRDTLPTGSGWLMQATPAPCMWKWLSEATLSLSSDYRYLQVAPYPTVPGFTSVGAPEHQIVAAGLGAYREDREDYSWPLTVCVEGECFDMTSGFGYRYLTLYSGARKVYLQIVANGGSAREIASTDP